MTMYGVECPACGSVRTGTAKAGFDGDGNRIRVRKCSNCDHSFTTVEAAYPFTFSRTDVLYRDRDRRMYARRVGYIPQSVPYWSRDVLKVSVSVTPGKRTNRCRKGLHVLTPDNTRHPPERISGMPDLPAHRPAPVARREPHLYQPQATRTEGRMSKEAA